MADDALVPVPAPEALPAPGRRRRLEPDELITLGTLLRQNVPLARIADQLGVPQATLKHACVEAKDRLESASILAVDDWIKASQVAAQKGFHQPAKDLLIAAKVIDPKPDVQIAAPTITVQVGFNLPGLPTSLQPHTTALPDIPTTPISTPMDIPQEKT